MFARQDFPNSSDTAPTLIQPRVASQLSGLSPQHLARMADRGQLTAVKPGGTHRRYVLDEIEAIASPTGAER